MEWSEPEVPQALVLGDESFPVQLSEEYDGRKLIFTTPAAALGAVAVANLSDAAPSVKNRLKVSTRKLENGDLSVKFDGNGNITSIQSLDDGAEYIQPGRLANLFQVLDDKPLHWSAWDVDVFAYETAKDLVRSESFEIVERGPVRASVQIVKRFGNSTIRQRISIGAFPGIHFDTEVDWREEDKMLKVAFPINVNASRATYEIQFGHVERPTHFNTSWDMARFEVCAQKWVDLSEGEQGVALINQGKYGHDVQGSVMRLSLLRSPKAPDPECDMGVHRFSYCILPHYGPLSYAGVVNASYAFNAPVHCVPLEPGSGAPGNLPPFISCEDRNIVIESVKKAEDSNDLIVRLYECHNSRGQAELFCARNPRAAWLCDMEENNLEELDVHDGAVLFEYKPFEILTLKLQV